MSIEQLMSALPRNNETRVERPLSIEEIKAIFAMASLGKKGATLSFLDMKLALSAGGDLSSSN